MTWEIGFVLFVVMMMMIALLFELARPYLIVLMALAVLLFAGIVTPEEALKGFSNEGMLTIALLFIISGTIQKSGIAERLIRRVLSTSRSDRGMLAKILLPVSSISAFVNNTPIVVTFTPILRQWCADQGVSPSKFLIPLSYATILGGTITLIGTSTNLVVHGLLIEEEGRGFTFFQLAVVGIPITLAGLFYILLVGYKLLPNYKMLTETVQEQSREYLSEMIVEPDYPFVNQMVKDAGLRKLKGLFLLEIIRGDEKISPVKGTTTIKSGDRLIFTGMISTIAELQRMKGLRLETGSGLTLDQLKNGNTQLVEAVVSAQSSLVYKKLKDTEFRAKFDAGVIAVHRNSERIKSKIGDIVLKPGDILLLLAGADFEKRSAGTNDFYVVTPLETPAILENQKKGWIAIAALLAMILFVVFQGMSMFKAMSFVVVLLFLFKLVTPEEAKRYIQFHVLLLIAGSLGIGAALIKTGAAEWVAEGLVSLVGSLGILAMLMVVYLLTNLFTEVITNSAAAVMMFPIGIEVAGQIGLEPVAMAVIIAIAASASFVTPIGYQTNLIVYGPGGYRFTDYVKIGLPLSVLVMVITVLIVYVVWMA